MRVSLSFVFALAISLSCMAITTPSFAKPLNCQRYQAIGVTDFESRLAYDSWFPKQINIEVHLFKAIEGRKSLKAKDWATNTLLPNGKLVRVTGHASTDAKARYKCDMKPEGVLAAQKTQVKSFSPDTELTKCYEGVLESCNEKNLCGRATIGKWVDGNRIVSWEVKGWQEYVKEAKRRGLSCGVSEVSSQPTTQSSASSTTSTLSKADKSKAFCKDIGFTAGTEKFGECVLKMMDK